MIKMKTILNFLIAVAISFSLVVPSLAVDKKEKKEKKKTSIQKKSEIKKKAVTKNQPLKKLNVKSKKKYDSFIDRNKNGIDDRAEKGKLKKPPPKKTVKKSTKPKKSTTKKKKD